MFLFVYKVGTKFARDHSNLTTLPIGSVHTVDGWLFQKHYGTDRFLISLGGKL